MNRKRPSRPVRMPRSIRRAIGCGSMSVARHHAPRGRSQNIKAIGERRLHGRYELEVIDAYQQAELARDEQIIVLPTLIKSLPGPLRRMVGDLSDEEQVLLGLGLDPQEASADDAPTMCEERTHDRRAPKVPANDNRNLTYP